MSRVRLTLAAVLLVSAAAHADTDLSHTLEHVRHHHGGQTAWLVLADRLEGFTGDSVSGVAAEADAWWGTDEHRLWLKGELEHEDTTEFDIEALYSKPVSRYWDLQAGLRHADHGDVTRAHAVFGIQGLAPGFFEVDSALYLSERGDLSAAVEVEYDAHLTQRWVLQPRIEAQLAASDDIAAGVSTGLYKLHAGLRLRYEFSRQFAPYIGVDWSRVYGDSADAARLDGERTQHTVFVAGLRFWL